MTIAKYRSGSAKRLTTNFFALPTAFLTCSTRFRASWLEIVTRFRRKAAAAANARLRTCYATGRLQRMRSANIVTGIISAVWFALFVIGRDLTHGVYLQSYQFAPNAGQVDYYVIYPLVAVVLLLFAGWTGNIWRKPVIALVPALLLGFAILPFLLGYTGGM